MRTLRIEKGRILIDGDVAELSGLDNKNEFFSSLLTLDVELASDISLYDIIHFFYDSKDLIKSVFSEEYEVVRALVTATVLPKNYKEIRLYKSFSIEKEVLDDNKEFIYMLPEVEITPSAPGEEGIRNLSGLRIFIDEKIQLNHEETGVVINSNTKFSLLDLMTCLFEELASILKEGKLLSH